jgi:4a-hydroxytetrahydrobiopterin dehydratase
MSDLTAQRCEPCEGGVAPLTRDEAQALMEQLNEDWSLTEDATEIRRDFHFKGFNKTMGFVNAVAWIANAENHHPDLEVGWGRCLVRYTTHAIGGLSQNDFICAAKIDALLPE